MKVDAEIVGKRIRVTATGFRIARLNDTVPGASFSQTAAAWTAPLTRGSCVALRERFGPTLRVGRQLSSWYRSIESQSNAMRDLGRLMDAELQYVDDVAPDLAQAMEARTYQRVGARFIATGRDVLIADEMGLGKTLEIIAGVIESGVPGPYLVVCPKTNTEAVWSRELLRWLDDGAVVSFPEGRAARQEVWEDVKRVRSLHDLWVIVHPQMVATKSWWICGECGSETPVANKKEKLSCDEKALARDGRVHFRNKTKTRHDHEWPELFEREWGAIINDESQNSLIRRRGKPTQVRNGMMLLPLREDGMRLAASGTPMRSKSELLFGTLQWLRPKEFTSYWNWARTYFEVTQGYGLEVGRLRTDREALLWSDLDRIVLRRTKAEVAPDLPPKSYMGTDLGDEEATRGVWLPMEGEQARLYGEMLKDSVANLAESGQLNAIGVLAELTRLKQFASSVGRAETRTVKEKCQQPEGCPTGPEPHTHEVQKTTLIPTLPSNKVEWILEMLEQMGYPEDPSGKVVIVSQFTAMLKLLEEALSSRKISNCKITGEVTGPERVRTIERFHEESGPSVMLLQTKTGGVGITIDCADHMIFIDETWVPDDQEQAEDRIHRVSNPRPVFYYYLRSLGSIDEAIAMANAELQASGKRLLDGRRGIEFARHVIDLARKAL